MIQSAEKYESDIVWGFHTFFNEKVSVVHPEIENPFFKNELITDKEEFLKQIMFDNIKSYTWSKLYKIDLFNGIKFPDGRVYEDLSTTYKFVAASEVISVVAPPHSIYYYRVNPKGIVQTQTFKRSADIYMANKEKYEFSVNNKLDYSHIIYSSMADSALSCIHCRARGNELPKGILDEVCGLIRSVSIKDIKNLSIKFKRKVLLAFAHTNSSFYLFTVRIAYKIIKK